MSEWETPEGVKLETPMIDYDDKGPTYAKIPTVYGDKPILFKLHWMNILDWGKRSPPEQHVSMIELPPNGKPAPKLPSAKYKVGRWTVELSPEALIGPEFLPRYKVNLVEAKPNETYLVELTQEWDSSPPQAGYLLLTKSEQPTFKLRSRIKFLHIVIRRVEPVSIPVEANSAGSVARKNILNLVGPNKKHLVTVWFVTQPQSFYALTAADDLFNITIDQTLSRVTHRVRTTVHDVSFPDEQKGKPFTSKDGAKHTIHALKQVEKAFDTVTLDPQMFPRK